MTSAGHAEAPVQLGERALGTVKVRDPLELGTLDAATCPLNRTVLEAVKPVPVTVTAVPTGPDVGASDAMVGATGVAVTVTVVAQVPVPPAPVTVSV